MAASKRCLPHNRGFTLLELVVVVVIVSVLFVVAVDRLLKLQAEAERAAVAQTVGALRSALALEIAAHIARGNLDGLAALVGTNPMDRLAQAPPNYLGALEQVDPFAIDPGYWYYDRVEGALVYRLDNAEDFESPLAGPPRIRFKILPVYDDNNATGSYEAAHDTIKGLDVGAVEPFRWRGDPAWVQSFVTSKNRR